MPLSTSRIGPTGALTAAWWTSSKHSLGVAIRDDVWFPTARVALGEGTPSAPVGRKAKDLPVTYPSGGSRLPTPLGGTSTCLLTGLGRSLVLDGIKQMLDRMLRVARRRLVDRDLHRYGGEDV